MKADKEFISLNNLVPYPLGPNAGEDDIPVENRKHPTTYRHILYYNVISRSNGDYVYLLDLKDEVDYYMKLADVKLHIDREKKKEKELGKQYKTGINHAFNCLCSPYTRLAERFKDISKPGTFTTGKTVYRLAPGVNCNNLFKRMEMEGFTLYNKGAIYAYEMNIPGVKKIEINSMLLIPKSKEE